MAFAGAPALPAEGNHPEAHVPEGERVDDRFELGCAHEIPNQFGGGAFRLNTSRILLTYAGLYENELGVDRAFEELVGKTRGGCREIIVCAELHERPADEARRHHIHAYVYSANKWDTRNRHYFDVRGRNGRALNGLYTNY